jgi:hypothetical protein
MTALSLASESPFGRRVGDLAARCRSLIPEGSRVFWFSDTPQEVVVARFGPVEIRETAAGVAAQTCAKGGREQALATALGRLGRFIVRNDRSGIHLRFRCPLLQCEEAPGRWLVSIAVADAEPAVISPASRGGRVKLRAVPRETLAVLRLPGRCTPSALGRGMETILNTLATTSWAATETLLVRLYRPPWMLTFGGRCEIAVRVTTAQEI